MAANISEFKGACQHCGEVFFFPAEMSGQRHECPHCGQFTLLKSMFRIESPDTKTPTEKKPLLADPDWVNRLPEGPTKTMANIFHAALKVLMVVFWIAAGIAFIAMLPLMFGALVQMFVGFMRFLHYAWGQ